MNDFLDSSTKLNKIESYLEMQFQGFVHRSTFKRLLASLFRYKNMMRPAKMMLVIIKTATTATANVRAHIFMWRWKNLATQKTLRRSLTSLILVYISAKRNHLFIRNHNLSLPVLCRIRKQTFFGLFSISMLSIFLSFLVYSSIHSLIHSFSYSCSRSFIRAFLPWQRESSALSLSLPPISIIILITRMGSTKITLYIQTTDNPRL